MNLNYSISEICNVLNAQSTGDKNLVISNIIIDSRSPLINEKSLFVALKGSKTSGDEYIKDFEKKGGKIVLVSQPCNLKNINEIIVDDTLKALQQIAIFHRKKFNIPVIGITGSNGKTIVKEWLFHVLKNHFNIVRSPKSYNSQIGVALSVLEMNQSHDLGIFEAGISMPGEMEILEKMIQPTIGVYTGIGTAHQENFTNTDQKIAEKHILFKSVNYIIEPTELKENLNKILPFNDTISKQNSSLVYQCVEYLNIPFSQVKENFKSLPKISMRMERMEGRDKNIIINDTYSLDEKSLEIALKYINEQEKNKGRILIISPSKNALNKNNLSNILNQNSVDSIYWIGEKIDFSFQGKIQFYASKKELIPEIEKIHDSIVLITGSRNNKLEEIIPFFIDKKHITQLQINLQSLKNNLNYFRGKINTTLSDQRREKTKILAMVKAQSYGGGITEMAKFLEKEKIDYLGVAYSDEGVELRKNGIKTPILVMNPEQSAFDDIIDYQLEPSIYSLKNLDSFISKLILKGISGFPIHLKIETGMNRLGFQKQEISELISNILAQPEVYVKSVFSHLASSDELKKRDFVNQQINLFDEITETIQNKIGYSFMRHIANTEAIENFPNSHYDMVRIGIGLFGLSKKNENLESVLKFRTEISQIKTINKGESVGYGQVFNAKRTTKLAVIPVGYADGLSRNLSNGKWKVKIGNQYAKIIGNVCMDMTMIDITNIKCKEGDEVEIFGWENSIQEMAKIRKTIPYEIISTISSRVHRIYIEE